MRRRQARGGAGLLLLLWAGAVAAAGKGDPLVEEVAGGATVDWRRGVVSAAGGAAADLRMPSAEVARAGAERRARAAAAARLGEALKALPLGGDRRLDAAAVSRALARARTAEVEYQSNGGAVVRLEVAFGDWAEAPATAAKAGNAGAAAAAVVAPAAPPVVLRLGAAKLAAAPLLATAGAPAGLVGARYEIGGTGPPPSAPRPLKGRLDKQGRIVIEDAAVDVRELAGRPGLIYVEKIIR